MINATGVVLHTNLGRAPLARQALDAMREVASGFSNLEYEIDAGVRGSRHRHCADLLCELTGADDAMVVNNCAAALVLALNTVADGRDAVISRGELVEIGGGFRIQYERPRTKVPVYIAAISPKSIRQAGEVADGVIPIHWPVHLDRKSVV